MRSTGHMLVYIYELAKQESAEWAITSVLHDATVVAGSGAGAMLSAVHGFNTGMPFVQKYVKGPKWLPLVIGIQLQNYFSQVNGCFINALTQLSSLEQLPPLLTFSTASAAFGEAAGGTPNEVIVVVVLAACADLGALDLEIARDVFYEMKERTVVSWSAMIGGYTMHGQAEEALKLFSKMSRIGIRPNGVTFIGLSHACSHMGLVDEGCGFFSSMTRYYEIIPQIEHYGCMVDLLSRSGLLQEAHEFIKNMPIKANGVVWGALLGGCLLLRKLPCIGCISQHYCCPATSFRSATTWRGDSGTVAAFNVVKIGLEQEESMMKATDFSLKLKEEMVDELIGCVSWMRMCNKEMNKAIQKFVDTINLIAGRS
ncbi:hypothetical protein IFM89_029891 [Coptis chinensis]|uniref:Pentatricopeptide repeat-containing protein n=1 Tax=Coptis chinensis TaxID=261450 RepID=A0A835HGH3_9MAGN|nr:hypothetical protein IFM89_029891 [Coptis chinensis]